MDSCSIDLVLGEEHFSGPYSVPLECHVASIQQPRGKGVLVGLYAHLQPTSHPQGFTGAKRLSFESTSPFAKASAKASVLDSFMTCVRKVNNQHPFRRTIVSSRASRVFEILEKFCVLNMDFVDFELHFSIESSVAIINSGKY